MFLLRFSADAGSPLQVFGAVSAIFPLISTNHRPICLSSALVQRRAYLTIERTMDGYSSRGVLKRAPLQTEQIAPGKGRVTGGVHA